MVVLWVRRAPASPRHNRGRIPVLLVVAVGLSSDRPPHHPGRINSLNHLWSGFHRTLQKAKSLSGQGQQEGNQNSTNLPWSLDGCKWILGSWCVLDLAILPSLPISVNDNFFVYVCIFHEWIWFATSSRYIQSRLLRSKPPCVCMDYIVAFFF